MLEYDVKEVIVIPKLCYMILISKTFRVISGKEFLKLKIET